MISTTTIEAVKALDIVDVIGKFVNLKKAGTNYTALSPFTEEKSPSFTVSTSKGIWKCFSSGKGGSGSISFVMEHESLSFPEAIEAIANSHGIFIEYDTNFTPEQKESYNKHQAEIKSIQQLLSWTTAQFHSIDPHINFTKKRAFKKEVLNRFQVGGTPDEPKALTAEAIKAGYTLEILQKAGLTNKGEFDCFHERTIFPIHDYRGNVVAFIGRINEPNTQTKPPKYYNSPDSLWQKGHHLYGLHLAIDKIQQSGFAYMVEGNPDVIRCHQVGLTNTVAPCGTSLTIEQIKLLKRYTEEIVLLPDYDIEKKDNPGIAAMHRNALLLIENGFTVSVCIPATTKTTTNTDPDEWIKNLRTPDKIDKWLLNTEDYISAYLVRDCITLGDKSAKEKANQVKRLGEVLELLPNTTLRNIYYDNIGKEWQDFKRKYKLIKRDDAPSNVQLDKLKKDDKEDFFEYGFYEKDNCYFTMNNGRNVRICSFKIDILYFVVSSENPKYVCKFTNVLGRSRIAPVTTDDFTSVAMFKKIVGRLGLYIFEGSDTDLNKLKLKLFNGVKEASEPQYMGYNPYHKHYTWANGLSYNGNFYKADKYGIVTIQKSVTDMESFKKLPPESHVLFNGDLHVILDPLKFIAEQNENTVQQYIDAHKVVKLYYHFLPFASTLKFTNDEDDQYEFQRKFTHFQKTGLSFNQWAKLFVEVYGDNGIIAICYYIMALYRDIVFKGNNSYIPILGFFGLPQSGKSTCARSLSRMFGTPPLSDGVNLESGATPTAILRYLSSMQNSLLWLNEYKNTISEQKRGMIKGIADGTGKLAGRNTGGNETKSYVPKSAVILCGQDLPTQDAATLTRTIINEFDKENRNPEAFQKLLEAENKLQTTSVTHELLQHQHHVEQYYTTLEPSTTRYFKTEMREKHKTETDDRGALNFSSITVPVTILMEKTNLEFPFTIDQLEKICIAKIKNSIAIQHTSNDVEKYFQVVASCIGREVMEGIHYKFGKGTDGITRLYLRTRTVHPFYLQAANRQGVTALDTATINSYLHKHATYMESLGNVRFDNLKNGTSCMVFNYDLMTKQDIEFSSINDLDDLKEEKEKKETIQLQITK